MTAPAWASVVAAVLAPLRRTKHYVCDEDCWYTCSAATEERDGGHSCDDSKSGKPCDCGLDVHNAKVDEVAARVGAGIAEVEDVAFNQGASWEYSDGIGVEQPTSEDMRAALVAAFIAASKKEEG